MDPNRPISRSTFLKISTRWLAGLLAAPITGLSYSRWIEPKWIQTNYLQLPYTSLPRAFHLKKIVQFSDIHLDFHFGIHRLEQLIARIRKLKPDLICFTGDLFHASVKSNESSTIRLLSLLEAPPGKMGGAGQP
ncbi:metallophosphoesterase [Cohnella ginsengisoli]|uniref:Metallophosphoesterase n=1 Tax=Cohnella ginsengisoli TaxID=425004 RepID=A0A9X4KLD4_9BACL|nr:metallophosphoesterase [Cohnella ginsengisoli]MDG0791790.1 metallophosphoesterase [Cohnella ginsengisoli]